jgi:hypothetical protein
VPVENSCGLLSESSSDDDKCCDSGDKLLGHDGRPPESFGRRRIAGDGEMS